MGHEARMRQRQQDVTRTAGTIGVCSGDLGRYRAFDQCLAALEKPVATRIEYVVGGQIAEQRTRLARTFTGAWLWVIDDDHVFAPSTLMQLLKHLSDDSVSAVVPLCLQRFPPFALIAIDCSATQNACISAAERGLIEIGAAGGGGMLIRRRVFDGTPQPWFTVGQCDRPDEYDEDLWFCRQIRQAGFRLFCDFDLPLGHIGPAAVWPARAGGHEVQWLTRDSAATQSARIVERFASGGGPHGTNVAGGGRSFVGQNTRFRGAIVRPENG